MQSKQNEAKPDQIKNQSANAEEKVQIEAVIDGLYNALSEGNSEKAMDAYAAQNVMFTLAPPLQNISGDSPGADGVQKWLDTWADGPHYETKDRTLKVEGSLAFAYALVHMTGKKKETADDVDIWYRETDCLEKQAGQWKIVHQHESVPYYMDKDQRAATNLKPEVH